MTSHHRYPSTSASVSEPIVSSAALGYGLAALRIFVGIIFFANGLAKVTGARVVEIGWYLGVLISRDEALNAYYGGLTPTLVPCSPPAPAPTTGAPVTVPPFDPTDEAEVNVYAQVAVTFATEAEATPAT